MQYNTVKIQPWIIVLLCCIPCCCATKLNREANVTDMVDQLQVYWKKIAKLMVKEVWSEQPSVIREEQNGRTFGGIKRLQLALLPIMYKMGVMSTLLVALTVISVKGLFIGIILLIINLSTFLAKLHVAKQGYDHSSGFGHKDVHLHIHSDSVHGISGGYYSEHSPYEHYSKSDGLNNFYNNGQTFAYKNDRTTHGQLEEDSSNAVLTSLYDTFKTYTSRAMPADA